MDRPLTEMRHALEEARDWLRAALDYATEDPDACRAWPVLEATAIAIEGCLKRVEWLLPLHPEIEARIKQESDYMDDYDSPESLGLRP